MSVMLKNMNVTFFLKFEKKNVTSRNLILATVVLLKNMNVSCQRC